MSEPKTFKPVTLKRAEDDHERVAYSQADVVRWEFEGYRTKGNESGPASTATVPSPEDAPAGAPKAK